MYLIQKRVIRLLQKNNKKPLNIVSKDNCSEMSRLVGCWIIKKIPKAKIYILKGINIQNTNLNHDIIASGIGGKIDLIDPTIWQFFKDKKSIFVKRVNNLDIALIKAKKIYGGKWEISEILNINDYNEKELKKIIILNINS